MTKTEVHVLSADGRWSFKVNGVDFGAWSYCRALKMALRMARALSNVPEVTAKVVVHEPDGAVRAVLSFGDGMPLRLHRRGRDQSEASLPLALAVRYHRDLALLSA